MVQNTNFNLCNYITIPLLMNKMFYLVKGFQNSYLNLEEYKILIVAHPEALENAETVYEVNSELAVGEYSIPETVMDVFNTTKIETLPIINHFVNGEYRKIDKQFTNKVFELFPEGSIKAKTQLFKNHYWYVYALHYPHLAKPEFEEALGITLNDDAELFSKPFENNFATMDELLEKLVIEHESTE